MSRTSPRTYVPLDCRFFDDDRVLQAGEAAAFLFLNILCAVKLDGSDGIISLWKIRRLNVHKYRQRVDKLIAVGLLQPLKSGGSDDQGDDLCFLVPSWSRWNLLSHQVEAKRETGRQAANRRWHSDGSTDGSPIGSPTTYPIQRESKKDKKGGSDPQSIGHSVDKVIKDLERERYS